MTTAIGRASEVQRFAQIIECVSSQPRGKPQTWAGPAMSKAAQAFRTISEVAEDLQVQKHVLRFWELKFPQIKPMKRGGGRRYYRPEDVELLRGIRNLLHAEGYTIKGVQKILREQGVDTVKFASGEAPVEVAAARTKGARGAKSSGSVAEARSARNPGAKGATARGAGQDSQARAQAQSVSSRSLGSKGEAGPIDVPPFALKTVRSAIAELEACRSMLLAAGTSKRPSAKPQRRSRAATS